MLQVGRSPIFEIENGMEYRLEEEEWRITQPSRNEYDIVGTRFWSAWIHRSSIAKPQPGLAPGMELTWMLCAVCPNGRVESNTPRFAFSSLLCSSARDFFFFSRPTRSAARRIDPRSFRDYAPTIKRGGNWLCVFTISQWNVFVWGTRRRIRDWVWKEVVYFSFFLLSRKAVARFVSRRTIFLVFLKLWRWWKDGGDKLMNSVEQSFLLYLKYIWKIKTKNYIYVW